MIFFTLTRFPRDKTQNTSNDSWEEVNEFRLWASAFANNKNIWFEYEKKDKSLKIFDFSTKFADFQSQGLRRCGSFQRNYLFWFEFLKFLFY